MAEAQLMEEQLQQSVLMSEQDAIGEDDISMDNDAALSSNEQIDVGVVTEDGDEDEEMVDVDESHDEEEDDEQGSSQSEDDDQSEEDDDAFGDEDAEGEDDDEEPVSHRRGQAVKADPADEDEEDDEDEGVGAVKIKPGETDDEDESDASSSASSANISEAESEDEGEWDETKVEGEEEDEESDNGNTNTCIFCKQDEEHDPAEDFEAFLACSGCGENAHQQCAREAGVPPGEEGPNKWKCPDCAGDNSDESDAAPGPEEEGRGSVNGTNEASVSPSSRRATAPKLARDLLPSQKGSIKPDSHSVFNQLVLDEDPMDGSRVLRKRKTSSAELEDGIMALRKRRRDTNEEQSEGEVNGQDESARPHSARSMRIKTPNAAVSFVKRTRTTAVVMMCVPATELRQILSQKPKRDRRDRKRKRSNRPPRNDAPLSNVPLPPLATPFTSASYSQPFYSFYDKETDELKGKPYGGILTEAEADTTKTMPTNEDRRRFDEAKQKADEVWRQRILKLQAQAEVAAKKTKKGSGSAGIECIAFGDWEIDTWYAAPYPEEYSRNSVLYICEFCLKYMNSDYVAWRHKLKCPAKHPPGDEIYRHKSVSVFEVDGRKNPVYCQNLCLLAKLFLGSKTLYYDVEPFLFYVLCEYDDLGYHFVGYFSKEKRASSQNNVSCILTLPIHQRKGYGNLLIDFSYLLTRVEEKTGSPEKPLSDMGLVSYRNYWRLIMCRYLLEHMPSDKEAKQGLSIKKISDDTGLTADDVISALEGLRCLVRDPQTHLYAFRVDKTYCREYISKWESKNYVQLNPSALTWTPYVMGRGNATNFELGPALTAIAPREEDDEPKTTGPGRETLVNGTGPVEPAIQEDQKVDPNTVLESTELNDNSPNQGDKGADVKPNGDLVNGEAQVNGTEQEANKDAAADWSTPYASIPPTRFEVVPPIAGSRSRADRSRPVVSRPPVVRTASTAPRPRPKRPSGSARRSSASKPKSSSKRKSGGTGRGPGRWPKGTKKSDYGNADSGPGFPPGWFAEREKSAALAAERAKDTVQVQTPTLKEAPSSVASKRNGSAVGKGSPRSQSRSQSQSGKEINDADAVMEGAEDADGEEE
ncbi:hypothetical protein B0T16DRAFT_419154 [Cercophora newfieldiana]|uniref:Histone acetyltransferase n=1 Tax=Cercophora newfieldiana TaxID=92897 RepID=A0AA40CL71_9PEZI|nr:hypothetical protein B0T16DRAFT_419154 [Cercophora newfieldiana]